MAGAQGADQAAAGDAGRGLALIAINRVCGLVLPTSTKFPIDDVIGRRRADLLPPLVGAVVAATLIQGTRRSP